MSMLNELADRIGDLYRSRAEIQIKLAHAGEDERNRQIHILSITDVVGLGKTDADRKRALEILFAGDETLQKISGRQTELRDILADCQAEIDALEMQFKAERWNIRAQLARALEGKYGARAEFREPADGAFDGEADSEADVIAGAAIYDDETAEGDAIDRANSASDDITDLSAQAASAAGQAMMRKDEIPF